MPEEPKLIEKKYVSRGAEKLIKIAKRLSFKNKIVVDIGSSTGGFTEIALEFGAKHVYAIDVGYGLLEWKLRKNEKVTVMERTNARYLQKLPQPVDIFVIDVSFISLRLILPAVVKIIESQRRNNYLDQVTIAALIKPQFEATRAESSKNKGIIKDEKIKMRVIKEIKEFAQTCGLRVKTVVKSPIVGAKGNEEFFLIGSI